MAPQVVSLLTIIEHQDFNPIQRFLTPAKLTPVLANIIGQILQQPLTQDQLVNVKPLAHRLNYLVKREAKARHTWARFKDKCRPELTSSLYTGQVIGPTYIDFS